MVHVYYLYKKVLFPHCNILIQSRSRSAKGIKAGDRLVAYPVRNFLDLLFPGGRLATLAEVMEVQPLDPFIRLQVKGVERVRMKRVERFRLCEFGPVPEEDGAEAPDNIIEELRKKAQEMVFLINVEESDKLIHLLNFLVSPSQLTDFITNYFVLKFPGRFAVYSETSAVRRAKMLVPLLDDMITGLKMKGDKELK